MAQLALLAVAGLGSMAAAAGQPAAAPPALDVLHVQGNVYMIAGDGGNIAVQVGPDGLVAIDSGAGRATEAVIAEIRKLGSGTLHYLINTSSNADHVGGNIALSASGRPLRAAGGGGQGAAPTNSGAAIVGHENVLLHMSAAKVPEGAWPLESFLDYRNLYLNGEAIQMLHQPAAHSDGDAIVFFRRSDVVAAGAIFDTTRFPVIDVANGGTVQGVIDALNRLILLVIPPTPLPAMAGGTKVIPGRGRVAEQADVVEYRDMITIIRDVVKSMKDKGLTLEQVQAANPTAGYTRRYGSDTGPWTTAMFVAAIYNTLQDETP
jgi:glyoxylase-like metal-dependent hydrolase (beta-lactamase superfamily II)